MPTSAATIDNAASRTASTAFGIQRDDSGQGTSPYDVRSIIDAIYINTGVIKGLEVTGGSDLTYTVAPGTAVCSKADADGKTLAPWHGGKTPAVNAGDPSNPRIDIVWIIAHNLVEDGDSDNLVTIGVTQGTPAVTPTAPAIPSGALPLQRFLMPAKALTTGAAVKQDQPTYAIQQGGSLGLLGEYWFKIDRTGPHKLNQSNYDLAVKVNLPTARYVDLLYKTCFSGEGSRGSQDTSHPSEYHICFQLDGKDIPHSAANMISYGGWETHDVIWPTIIPAGTHTIRVRGWLGYGNAPQFHYSAAPGNDSSGWVGELLQVWDKGPAI